MTYFLYLVRWGLLAIPGAWFLQGIQTFIPGLYWPMIVSQVLTGAWVFFVDRRIFKKNEKKTR